MGHPKAAFAGAFLKSSLQFEPLSRLIQKCLKESIPTNLWITLLKTCPGGTRRKALKIKASAHTAHQNSKRFNAYMNQ
jgi:hypothetical protein